MDSAQRFRLIRRNGKKMMNPYDLAVTLIFAAEIVIVFIVAVVLSNRKKR